MFIIYQPILKAPLSRYLFLFLFSIPSIRQDTGSGPGPGPPSVRHHLHLIARLHSLSPASSLCPLPSLVSPVAH